MTAKTIWCLFTIENDYDQPDYNLFAWWSSKPELIELSEFLNIPFTSDENILNIVHIFQGKQVRIGNTNYRLEQVQEGKELKND